MDQALRAAIQRKLREVAQNGRFYRVRYDSSGVPLRVDTSMEQPVAPMSNVVNETASEFRNDDGYGRDVHQRRASWQFEQFLGFDVEVDATLFEASVCRPVPRVARTEEYPSALLRLTGVQYDHPVTGGGGGGSNLMLSWEATISRFR